MHFPSQPIKGSKSSILIDLFDTFLVAGKDLTKALRQAGLATTSLFVMYR